MFVVTLLVLQLFSVSMERLAPAAGAEVELGSAMEWVLRNNTDAGASFVRRFLGIGDRVITEQVYQSFKDKLRLDQSRELAKALHDEGGRLQAQFEEYRVSKNRPPRLGMAEELTLDEREFLNLKANVLHDNALENMMKEQLVFVGVQSSDQIARGYDAAKKEFEAGAPDHAPGDEPRAVPGDDPAKPIANKPADKPGYDPERTRDTRSMQLNTWQRFWLRARAMRKFIGAVTLGEGDWRTLFVRSGKPFTAKDLVTIRKFNRLLDSINDYSQMRLVVRAFANEPQDVMNELLQRLAGAPHDTVDRFVAYAREKGKDLPLNDIAYEGIRRMLNVIERCLTLEHELKVGERNVWALQKEGEEARAALQKAKEAGDPLEIRKYQGDVDLARQRLDKSARILDDLSVEFVKNRDQLDIFVNLKQGMINNEQVIAFDLPDYFTIPEARRAEMAPYYERAIGRAINGLVKEEIGSAVQTQIGRTRTLVRDLNNLTQQVEGRMFTDTQVGQHLEQYAESRIRAVIVRVAKFLGVAAPSAGAIELAKQRAPGVIEAVKRLWGDITANHVPDPQPSPSPSPSPLPYWKTTTPPVVPWSPGYGPSPTPTPSALPGPWSPPLPPTSAPLPWSRPAPGPSSVPLPWSRPSPVPWH